MRYSVGCPRNLRESLWSACACEYQANHHQKKETQTNRPNNFDNYVKKNWCQRDAIKTGVVVSRGSEEFNT